MFAPQNQMTHCFSRVIWLPSIKNIFGKTMKQKIRCACGKSKSLPWCDGSHKGEDWVCDISTNPKIELGFVGPIGLINLLKRLAWRFDGEVIDSDSDTQTKKLIFIEDGSNLTQLKRSTRQLKFESSYIIGIDLAVEKMAIMLACQTSASVSGELSNIFFQCENIIDGWLNQNDHNITVKNTIANSSQLFISHSIADEGLLLPVVNTLRELTEQSIFLCFDSIENGEKWRRKITRALQESEKFILIVSVDSINSTFCAFETGYALSQGKEIIMISIDGTQPPDYISHLQCIDLQRQVNAMKWLDIESALSRSLLEAVDNL